MSDRSLNVFEYYREASQRFNYFIIGASGTFCAYLAQQWQPTKLGANIGTIEFLAFTFLGLSVTSGFLSLEKEILVLKNNFSKLYYGNEADVLAEAAFKSGGLSISNLRTNTATTPEELTALSKHCREQANFLDEIIDKTNDRVAFYYRWRNWLLALGSVTFILGRLLAAYTSA